MGACLLNISNEYVFTKALMSSFSYAVGFGLALILFAGVRERVNLGRVPKPLQDTSIGLITAGIIALTFTSFRGMV
jgi:electron transport complex protein RnfA